MVFYNSFIYFLAKLQVTCTCMDTRCPLDMDTNTKVYVNGYKYFFKLRVYRDEWEPQYLISLNIVDEKKSAFAPQTILKMVKGQWVFL
jgi:hypothetical protein